MNNTKKSPSKGDHLLNALIIFFSLFFICIIYFVFKMASFDGKPIPAPATTDGVPEFYDVNYTSDSTNDTAELKLDGIGLSYTAGNYICGIDFPPGKYDIQASKGRGNIFGTNGLNEIMSKEDDNFTVDSYSGSTFVLGDILSVTGTLKVTFGSNAAEIENYTGREETTDSFELETGNYLVGTDLPTGTYNIVCTNGSGNISTDSRTLMLNEIMSADDAKSSSVDMYIKSFNNAILEDAIILTLSGIDVKLTLTQPIE